MHKFCPEANSFYTYTTILIITISVLKAATLFEEILLKAINPRKFNPT